LKKHWQWQNNRSLCRIEEGQPHIWEAVLSFPQTFRRAEGEFEFTFTHENGGEYTCTRRDRYDQRDPPEPIGFNEVPISTLSAFREMLQQARAAA